ncbi:hypothetical protein HYV85_03450 [Candidatus Woesearchaeota archaeon]|nr:hypothetical protein [Candidatus Woesearchaeota archaeon]
MGVEEIQRINALARELMRHGIAQTSDEAVLKAEEMLRGNGVSSMSAAIASNSHIARSEPASISNEALSELNMDVRSLGVRLEAIVREVIGLKDEIKKLGGGLGDVNKQVMRMSIQQQQPVSAPSPVAAAHHDAAAAESAQQAAVHPTFVHESQVQAPQAQAPKAEQPRVTARAGREEFRPEDVAIEKIFYFGK